MGLPAQRGSQRLLDWTLLRGQREDGKMRVKNRTHMSNRIRLLEIRLAFIKMVTRKIQNLN